MNTAIFPGSFDPFTLGHYDVLISSLKLFNKIIISVGHNSSKPGFFTVEQRMNIIADSTAGLSNIEIASYQGLTVDFCKKRGVQYVVRGLRTTTDFEMERVIAQANTKIDPDILTIFISTCPEYSFISSTVVRDLLMNGGDAGCFLSPKIDINKYVKNK